MHKVLWSSTALLKDRLAKVFEVYQPRAQTLALDLYWELLKTRARDKHLCGNVLDCNICAEADDDFVSFVRRDAFTSNCSLRAVLDSIFGAMIDDFWQEMKPIPFNQTVIRPRLWEICFEAVGRSKESDFEGFLRECFVLVLDNPQNTIALCTMKAWQSWVIPLSKSPSMTKRCEAYIMGIISRLLYQSFVSNAEHFDDEVLKMLLVTQAYNSSARNCMESAYKFLHSFLFLVQSKRSKNPAVGFNYQGFLNLCRIVVHFIFFWSDYGVQLRSIPTDDEWPTFSEFIKQNRQAGIHFIYLSLSKHILSLMRVLLKFFESCEKEEIAREKGGNAMLKEYDDLQASLRSGAVLIGLVEDYLVQQQKIRNSPVSGDALKPSQSSSAEPESALAGIPPDAIPGVIRLWMKQPADKKQEFILATVPKIFTIGSALAAGSPRSSIKTGHSLSLPESKR
eukprot:TRINITY_DN17335_c0_g2_i3.p1 TRINITY_DN17335_c0_g2~~TRINITY_DN17335_c0_g2_i3.p1  ORF type:complete len:470 (+),score=110.17 TRINITY_DN17335_c0_g2_i3:55-1410(+)